MTFKDSYLLSTLIDIDDINKRFAEQLAKNSTYGVRGYWNPPVNDKDDYGIFWPHYPGFHELLMNDQLLKNKK
jgi:hypothetical protein